MTDLPEKPTDGGFTPIRGVRKPPILPVIILASIVAAALFAPWIAPHSPTLGRLPDRLLAPSFIAGGSPDHLLGTDLLGRDILSRIIYGSRISVIVALLGVFWSGALGTTVGVISGYFRGTLDAIFMRVTDIALSLPVVLMAILLAAAFRASLTNVIVVIILLLWPYYARQIRGEVLSIREKEFIALARVAGCSNRWIISRHILPNVLPTFLVLATLQVGYVILLEATLSFLGVGIPPPTPAWGLMVADGRELIASSWWVSLFPGTAILLAVFSGNLLGDWVRDRLDPKLRQI